MAEGVHIVQSDMCKYYGFQTKQQQEDEVITIYLFLRCNRNTLFPDKMCD